MTSMSFRSQPVGGHNLPVTDLQTSKARRRKTSARAADHGDYPSLSTPTGDTDLDAHLAWMALRGMRPATRYLRRRVLIGVLADTGRERMRDLTPAALDTWQRDLEVTDSARRTYVIQVQQWCAWALDEGIIEHDPSVVLVMPPTPKRGPRPISDDDLTLAIASAPERIRPWLILAGWAGLRAAEIAQLERADVLDTGDPPVIVVRDGKGGKSRVVPIGPAVASALRGYGMPAFGPVFPRLDGKPGPLKPWTVSQLANRHLHSIGMPESLHQARHRYLTTAYRLSLDLLLVAELAGHSSPSTTSGYVAYAQGAKADLAARMDATLRAA
jgi:integrase